MMVYLTAGELVALADVLTAIDGGDGSIAAIQGDALAAYNKLLRARDVRLDRVKATPRGDTLTLSELIDQAVLIGLGRAPAGFATPVRLIINGTAHPVVDLWFEPRQGAGGMRRGDGVGAVCIGDDPR